MPSHECNDKVERNLCIGQNLVYLQLLALLLQLLLSLLQLLTHQLHAGFPGSCCLLHAQQINYCHNQTMKSLQC